MNKLVATLNAVHEEAYNKAWKERDNAAEEYNEAVAERDAAERNNADALYFWKAKGKCDKAYDAFLEASEYVRGVGGSLNS